MDGIFKSRLMQYTTDQKPFQSMDIFRTQKERINANLKISLSKSVRKIPHR